MILDHKKAELISHYEVKVSNGRKKSTIAMRAQIGIRETGA